MSRLKKIVNDKLNYLVPFLFCFSCAIQSAPETRLYGDTGQNPQFLGCFGEHCGPQHPDSICNLKGLYGSHTSNLSIWNTYSIYGNKYRTTSLWNKRSIGLIMTDSRRSFLGRLEVMRSTPLNVISAVLDRHYSDSDKKLVPTQQKFCNFLEN